MIIYLENFKVVEGQDFEGKDFESLINETN